MKCGILRQLGVNPELPKAQEQFSSLHTTTGTLQRATKIPGANGRPWRLATQCHLSFLFRETEHRSQSTSPHFCNSYQLKDILLSTSLFFCNSFSVTLEKLVLSLLFLFLPFLISSFVLQIKPNYDQDLKLGFIMTWKSKLINFELKLQMIKNQCHQILKSLKIPFIISTEKSSYFL